MANFYVTMKDSFMSGWGLAEQRENILILECETQEEAEIVKENALNRSDMKYVEIKTKKPEYDAQYYLAQVKTKEDMPRWYEEGAFKKQ